MNASQSLAADPLAFGAIADPDQVVGLDELKPGDHATVVGVDVSAGAVAQRLVDLGFLPGTHVTVVRRAPLGDPVLYELRGFRLALRHNEAEHIRVSESSQNTVRLQS